MITNLYATNNKDIKKHKSCVEYFKYCLEDINNNSTHIQCGTVVDINNQTFTCSCSSTSCSSINECNTIYQFDEQCEKPNYGSGNEVMIPVGIVIFIGIICCCLKGANRTYYPADRYGNRRASDILGRHRHQPRSRYRPRPRPRPRRKTVLQLTTYTLDDIELIDDDEISENRECVICLDELKQKENEEKTIAKLKCEHLFHKKCISSWFDQKPDCPICRNSVVIDQETIEITI